MTTKTTTVLDARAVERTLKRMSVEIVELNGGTDDLILVGIQRRGVQLADRLVKMIDEGEGVAVPQGSLDITLYRDDLQTVGPRPDGNTRQGFTRVRVADRRPDSTHSRHRRTVQGNQRARDQEGAGTARLDHRKFVLRELDAHADIVRVR